MAKLEQIAANVDGAGVDYRAKLPLTATFSWAGVEFTGQLSDAGSRLVLIMIADIGKIPFSAENPKVRERMLKLAGAAKRLHTGTFHITSKQRLTYHDVATFDGEVNIMTVLTTLAQRALKAKPAIEFVRSLWN